MLPDREIPPFRDFLLLVGRLLLLALPLGIVWKVWPSLQSHYSQDTLADLLLLAALYPLLRKLGVSFGKAGGYLEGFRAELRPAFKYFLLMSAATFVADYAWQFSLAPWDAAWSNKLLFWNSASSNPSTLDSLLTGLLANPLWLPPYLFSICVFTPVVEEFLFRYWLYGAMRRRLPAAAAIALNAALFGAMHGTDFLGTGICGLFFCWTYERSGKLETPILVHAFTNGLAVALLFGEKLLGL